MTRFTRRRLLIVASAAGLAGSAAWRLAAPADLVWRGTALGADAEMRFHGIGEAEARHLADVAATEVERLEDVFSLYRPDSELSRLNRSGILAGPTQDFRLLLDRSLDMHRQTEGAFNVAIQPVWSFLARHFAQTPEAPDAVGLRRQLAHCDPSEVSITDSEVRLRPGMALTFNGIAQGYITDRVTDIFRRKGLTDILVNLGEIRALPGRPWQVAVAGSSETVELRDGAIAQSAGGGTRFTRDGRWHHLIDPRSGESANAVAAVTVRADTATVADALSTALFVAPVQRHRQIADRFAGVRFDLQADSTPRSA